MDETLQLQVIEQAKQRDQSAIYQLYSETRDAAYYVVKMYLRDERIISGVVKDAYLTALGNLVDMEPGTTFSHWLQFVLAVKCVGTLKAKKVKFDVKDSFMGLPGDGDLFPQEWVEDETRRWELLKGIENLPDPQRLALLMHYYGGLSRAEIGKSMGIDDLGANTHLHGAETAIRSGNPQSRSSKPAMTQLLEAVAEPMPADMAKSIYQDMMLFFMGGGKPPKLSIGTTKGTKQGSGAKGLVFLPYLIMLLAVIGTLVFLFVTFQSKQKRIGGELVAQYEASKAAIEAEERAYQEEAQAANPPGNEQGEDDSPVDDGMPQDMPERDGEGEMPLPEEGAGLPVIPEGDEQGLQDT